MNVMPELHFSGPPPLWGLSAKLEWLGEESDVQTTKILMPLLWAQNTG